MYVDTCYVRSSKPNLKILKWFLKGTEFFSLGPWVRGVLEISRSGSRVKIIPHPWSREAGVE
jgi:hypothetical protein